MNNEQHHDGINRRELLRGAVALSALTAAGAATAASGGHDHHAHHGGHAANPHEELIDSALDCVKTGTICQDHCVELIKAGDTSIAECLDSVQEMLAMCTALAKMAAYQSDQLKAVAKICAEVCRRCEKECRKHAEHHAQCKACAESCKRCIEACEKVAA